MGLNPPTPCNQIIPFDPLGKISGSALTNINDFGNKTF